MSLESTPSTIQTREDVCPTISPSTREADTYTTQCAAFEYIDALDANDDVVHHRHLHTLNYIMDLTDKNMADDTNAIKISYISHRWPPEWTKRVGALKNVRGEGWEDEVRMMNCMKMYGLSWTTMSVLVVHDHRSTRASSFL